jgi:hypothetical protein
MIDALESAIRTGNDLVIGLTVGQVLESMKKIHDRDDEDYSIVHLNPESTVVL